MQTKTKTISEAYENYLKYENELLEKDELELRESIELINPSFYLNRLLVKLFPESQLKKDLQCFEIIKENGVVLSVAECKKRGINTCEVDFTKKIRKYRKNSKKGDQDIILNFMIPYSNLNIGKKYCIESSLDIVSEDDEDIQIANDDYDSISEPAEKIFIPKSSSEDVFVEHIIKPNWLVNKYTIFQCLVKLYCIDEKGEKHRVPVKNGVDYSKKSVFERNKLIRKAMSENVRADIKKKDLYPLIPFEHTENMDAPVYEAIENSLMRNNASGINHTGLTRYKLFLLSFVLNLDYDTLSDLMVRCIGEHDFNYKDPYEVLLVYCLTKHTNVCEKFVELKKVFEKAQANVSKNFNSEKAGQTKKAKKDFEKIKNDEDLIEFLCTLPSTERNSSQKLIDRIFDQSMQEQFDLDFSDIDTNDKEQVKEQIKKCSCFADMIFGYTKCKGEINEIGKPYVLDGPKIYEIVKGIRKASKNDIVIFCFFKYVVFKDKKHDGKTAYERVCEQYDKYDITISKLNCLFSNFKLYINKDLNEAGFSELYLPNRLEKMVACSLVSKNPIHSFQSFFL